MRAGSTSVKELLDARFPRHRARNAFLEKRNAWRTNPYFQALGGNSMAFFRIYAFSLFSAVAFAAQAEERPTDPGSSLGAEGQQPQAATTPSKTTPEDGASSSVANSDIDELSDEGSWRCV